MQPWNLKPEEWSKILGDETAPAQAAKGVLSGQHLPWVNNLIELAAGSESTLDLGSGRGENSAILACHGKKTTLLDWAQDNISFSRQLYSLIGKTGEFVQADMTKPLPFPDNSFDLVFSCGVFEYFKDDQISAILKEAFRVAKKRVVILIPNALSIPYRVGMGYLKLRKQWHWGGEKPFATLKPFFRKCAARNIQEFSVGTKHSLAFLSMRGGALAQNFLIKSLKLTDHSRPAKLRQGYLLITAGDKINE